MSNRRAPLASVPNAVNSPYRVPAATTKRPREEIDQEDLGYEQEPLAKRTATTNGRLLPRTLPQKQSLQQAEARVFGKRPGNVPPTAFELRLLEAKQRKALEVQEREQEHRAGRSSRAVTETFEGIRQWQKHYRRVFPTFVFYFESVSDEARARHAKFIRAFGAVSQVPPLAKHTVTANRGFFQREEKFFSKEITHIITSRALPGDSDAKSPTDAPSTSSTNFGSQTTTQPRTINPSLLDRNVETQRQGQDVPLKAKFDFDTAIGRKVHASNVREAEPKRSAGTVDILLRAKDMGIKIWTLEKLERIAKTMLDSRADEPSLRGPGGRGVALNAPLPTKSRQEPDLSHLLRKEQLNGPSDAASTTSGIIQFKGPHIYVRCMDEKTKPILVKEFPRVARREDGEWPQFRGNSVGKCPFIVEQSTVRQDTEPSNIELEEAQAREIAERRQTLRARIVTTAVKNVPRPSETAQVKRQPLAESRAAGNAPLPSKLSATGQENFKLPPDVQEKPQNLMKEPSKIPPAARLRFFNGEPAASGMQPSNITSAIRSQMISSTAAQPGAKAGTSKEVHGLKRKVLERTGGPGIQPTCIVQKGVDPLGAARAERHIPMARQTRRQAQERLIHIDEESTQSEDDECAWRTEEVQQKRIVAMPAPKRDPKPGYCENCREKYDDFDSHVVDRKHRKFALSQENWKDLDKLLAALGRPLKEAFSDSHALGSRARKAGQGILTVRFEMPFAIWCTTCPKPTIIGQGVRFNAEKKKIGNYHSTPIFSFRMKHTACGGWIEIRTDPKNTAYVVLEGAKKRDTGEEKVEEGDMVIMSAEEREKLQSDAFAVLEGKVEEKKRVFSDKSRIEDLYVGKGRDWDDPYAASRRLRKVFRVERKARERDDARTEDLKDRMSFGGELLAESEEDRRRAGFVDFGEVGGELDVVKAKSKPLFGHPRQERPDSLQSELKNNTRLAADPFLNAEKPSSTIPLIKRRKIAALVDYDSDT
ncbi:MAG: hypothetical protein Q9219_000416 [cf. Caloplaca sp. 3 TL-2023]